MAAEEGRRDRERSRGPGHLGEDTAHEPLELLARKIAEVEDRSQVLGTEHEPVAVEGVPARQALEEAQEHRDARHVVVRHARVARVRVEDDGALGAAPVLRDADEHLARLAVRDEVDLVRPGRKRANKLVRHRDRPVGIPGPVLPPAVVDVGFVHRGVRHDVAQELVEPGLALERLRLPCAAERVRCRVVDDRAVPAHGRPLDAPEARASRCASRPTDSGGGSAAPPLRAAQRRSLPGTTPLGIEQSSRVSGMPPSVRVTSASPWTGERSRSTVRKEERRTSCASLRRATRALRRTSSRSRSARVEVAPPAHRALSSMSSVRIASRSVFRPLPGNLEPSSGVQERRGRSARRAGPPPLSLVG